MVEDTDPAQLVDISTWVYIANLILGFISPVAAVFISCFSLVPTMRGFYFFATVMFILKTIVTHRKTKETEQGKVRMKRTRWQDIFGVLDENKGVFRAILRTPQTLYAAGVMLISGITSLVSRHAGLLFRGDAVHQPDALQGAVGDWVPWIWGKLAGLDHGTQPDYVFLAVNALLEASSYALSGQADCDIGRPQGTSPNPVDPVCGCHSTFIAIRLNRWRLIRHQQRPSLHPEHHPIPYRFAPGVPGRVSFTKANCR